MRKISNQFYSKQYWLEGNLRYSEPHYTLEKCARIVNRLSKGRSCDLLDIGCGPATLAKLLKKNINYFGIDLAIHDPAPNLLEMDISQNEIRFGNKKFDLIVMRGILEYLGDYQQKKFSEILQIMNKSGRLVLSYVNFNHLNCPQLDKISIYNNMRPIRDLRRDLELYFHVDRCFPSSYNWYHGEPRGDWLVKIQMPLEINIPVFSRLFAVEYFFICFLVLKGKWL